MIAQTYDLKGPALNYAVAKCLKFKHIHCFGAWKNKHGAHGLAQVMVSNKKNECYDFDPASNWADGGPIIDQFAISVVQDYDTKEWLAGIHGKDGLKGYRSPTALQSAMQSLVASQLGPEVDIPTELLS